MLYSTTEMQDKVLMILGGITLIVVIAIGVIIAKAPRPNQPVVDSLPSELLQLADSERVWGNDNAPVTLIEYSDFQCPACKVYYPMLSKLKEDYPDKVRIVFRHFPLTIHKNARIAARASEAANVQGKFWQMHDRLFETQEDWSELSDPKEKFKAYAIDIELDVDKFMVDLENSEFDTKVQNDVVSGNTLKVNATPTFYINGEKIPNPKSYEDFKSIIDAY
jgi:protein-disulfide isomerase